MRLAALVVAALGCLAAGRWMALFLWRARHSVHDFVAWAVALSAGSITGFAALVLVDLIWNVNRWIVHAVAGVLFVIMFSVWSRIMDVLMTVQAGMIGRRPAKKREALMTTFPPPDGAPAIPPRVRTVAYFAGLGVGALTTLITGVVAAVAPDAAVTVLAVCGAFSSAAALVLGGLGVAFRPTAGLPRESDLWGDGTPVSGPVVGDPPAGG